MLPWLVDSLFPRRCVGCGREGLSWICHDCRWQGEGWPRWAYPDVLALAPFQTKVVREAIHGLKYHSLFELAEELVGMLWPDGLVRFLGVSEAILVPVPTSFARRKQRGFNQAELVARAFSKRLGWPVRTDLLVKTARGTQVGKGRSERGGTGYALRGGAVLPEAQLVLVDDLCTTGSTLAACRQVLGRKVPAVVLAMD